MLLFDVLSTVMPLLMVGLLLLGIFLALHYDRRDKAPPELWQAPVPSGLVRVTGEVLGGNPFSPWWRIRYPLPDGTDGELRAAATRPHVLHPGMRVPVLVDPQNATRARLDVPTHAAIVSLVKWVWIGIAAVAGAGAVVAGLVFAVLRLS